MVKFEYKVVPAPKKGAKSWGLKSTEDRFATALSKIMNDLAAEGWEYQRSDTLPCEEKSGFRGRATVFQNMLIFRREASAAVAERPARKAAPALTVVPAAEPVVTAQEVLVEPPVSRPAEAALPTFMRIERDPKPDVAAE